jgi:RNA polymerase sigma-70 factor (ECF subfamily)
MQRSENLEEIIDTKSEMSSSGNVDPESHTEAGFIQKNIDKAIEKLSKRERTIFVMRNYSGLSFGEIVKILKLRPGTVRSTNFKALEKLRKELAFYKDEI